MSTEEKRRLLSYEARLLQFGKNSLSQGELYMARKLYLKRKAKEEEEGKRNL